LDFRLWIEKQAERRPTVQTAPFLLAAEPPPAESKIENPKSPRARFPLPAISERITLVRPSAVPHGRDHADRAEWEKHLLLPYVFLTKADSSLRSE